MGGKIKSGFNRLARGSRAIGRSPMTALGVLTPGTPKQPQLPVAKVMPTQDDEEVQDAKRRALARQRARKGRASTILTGGEERLG